MAPFVEESVDELGPAPAGRADPVRLRLAARRGFPEPKDFFENVANFSVADQRRIMYENARELTFS